MRKLAIILLVILTIIITLLVIYRYQIFQYSAESIIKKLLPDYVKVDKITFDLIDSKMMVKGLRVLNPPGFSSKNMLEMNNIKCSYRMKGKHILDGVEMIEPKIREITLNIERLSDGRLNLNEINMHVEGAQKGEPSAPVKEVKKESQGVRILGNKTLSDIIKLPGTFDLKKGRVIFTDRMTYNSPHVITFENISTELSLKLNSSYTMITGLGSTGDGNLNGRYDEIIRWTVSWDPTTPKLTMSNRFHVSDLDILTFEPYYDKYSPFIFKRGRFSGDLVFDFDNGNIGSTNEIRLANFVFYIKKGYENAAFWETTVPDLVKYFSSSFGEIVFDFKIKGDMEHPQFYLGPISKQAITSMAIDKISNAIQAASSKTEGAGSTAPKSDIEKAKEYIDLFKGFIKK